MIFRLPLTIVNLKLNDIVVPVDSMTRGLIRGLKVTIIYFTVLSAKSDSDIMFCLQCY